MQKSSTNKVVARSLPTLTTTFSPPMTEGPSLKSECSTLQCYGLNFFTVESGLVVLLTLLNISMIIMLVVKIRREENFRQAFYVQFVAVTVVDCLRMLQMFILDFRMATGLIKDTKLYEVYIQNPVGNSLVYAQSMLHAHIAVNRFTAFFFPMSHSEIWSKRTVRWSLVGVAVLSVTMHALPMYIPEVIAALSPTPIDLIITGELDDGINSIFCLACGIMSFVLCVITIAKLRTLAGSGQLRETNTRRDAILLAQSTYMVALQLLISLCMFTENFFIFVQVHLGIYDGSKRSRVWWFRLLKTVCFFLWDTMIKDHFTKLYALSGSVVLLLISGHVRVAYASFYFKHSTKVVRITAAQSNNSTKSQTRSTDV